MNSALNAQRNNLTFFIAAIVVSVLMLAASGFILNSLILGKPGQYLKVAQKSCETALKSNGFHADSSNIGEIKVMQVRKEQIELLVNKSSVLIASCPAYTLTDFCAGAACQIPGVSFTLKQKEL